MTTTSTQHIRYEALGPVRILVDGEERNLGGPQRRQVLGLLIAGQGRSVSTDRMIDAMWPHDVPATARKSIQGIVHHLRGHVGDQIATEGNGYSLVGDSSMGDVHIDVVEFEALVKSGRDTNDPVAASTAFRRAVELWKGDPYSDMGDLEALDSERVRLNELHLVALEGWYESRLRAGSVTELVADLEGAVSGNPLRDRFRRQLMLALFRAGRQRDALAVFQKYRADLAEAGLEPPSEAIELERLIAVDDEALKQPNERRLLGYTISERLGEGAFSIVYRGHQPSVDRDVAIKQIRADLANRPQFIRRFEAEARMVANLEHPHIVPLIDYWREPGSAFLVMRLLRGGSLASAVMDGPWSLDRTVTMVEQVGAALAASHKVGIVHRDVKSANILLDEDGNAYLTDFGIALEAADADDPESALSAGSPAYASPEQLRREPVGPAADVHGLAIAAYETLTGRLPFPDEPNQAALLQRQLNDPIPLIRHARSDVPVGVEDVIQRATSKAPSGRFPTVREFVTAFSEAASPTSVHTGRGVRATSNRTAIPTHERNPYRGLLPFDEPDARYFAGRERLVAQLLDVLTEQRVVAVVGPSGSGKSSVVKAGVLPALRQGQVRGSDSWYITTITPGRRPFEELEAALHRVAIDPPAGLLGLLTEGPRGLARALRRVLPENGQLLLAIDQFEELFTLCDSEEDRRLFLEAIASAVTDERPRLRVILTLRADFYDRPLRYESIGRMVRDATVAVLPLAADELEHAIVDPAAAVGAEFEPGLLSEIVADVADQPGALPMLQYALTELYERRISNLIMRDSYREIGGLGGAVARAADDLYMSASETEQHAIRDLFGELVMLGDGAHDTRRRVRRSELGASDEMVGVIDRFGSARLLSFDTDPSTREPTVEVAHEALIREWPRCQSWLEEDRDDLRTRRHLDRTADEWDKRGRQDAELYSGGRLEGAEAWVATHAGRLTEVPLQFLDASRARRTAAADAEKRTKQRLQRLLAAVGAALVLALGAGVYAFIQEQRADDEAAAARASADEADIATLISRSAAQSTDDPELAVLLALEAHRRAPRPDTEQAVLNAIGSGRTLNRIASGDDFDTTACRAPTFVDLAGTTSHAILGGRIVSKSFETGEVTDHGTARDECGIWWGDPASNRVVVGAADISGTWVGTYEDPYAVEIQQQGPAFALTTDLSTGVVALGLVGGGPPRLGLFDATTGEMRGGPIDHGELLNVAVDPSGTRVAASFRLIDGSAPAAVFIIDALSGEEIHRIDLIDIVFAFAFDATTDELIVGTLGGEILTIDPATGNVLSTVEARSGVGRIHILPDGMLLAATDLGVERIDRHAGPSGDVVVLGESFVGAFRADGSILTFEGDGRYALVELEGNAFIERTWHVETNARVSINAGVATILPRTGDTTTVLDLSTGDRTEMQLVGTDGEPFLAYEVYPDSTGLWALSALGTLAHSTNGVMTANLELEISVESSLRYGDTLGVIGRNNSGQQVARLVKLDPRGSQVAMEVPTLPGDANLVHPTREGGLHVVFGDGRMLTYDAEGLLIDELQTTAHTPPVHTMDATTGRMAIVSQAWPAAVVVVDPATGTADVLDQRSGVNNLGFARDGDFLVITGDDGDVHLWDLERGESAGLVWNGTGASRQAEPSWYDASTDSVWVYTSGRLLEIPLDSSEWVARACEFVGRDLTAEEWTRFVPGDDTVRSGCA